jgi:integrase
MYACIYEAGGGSMPLLGKGVHPKFVQELLGHATIAITLDTYSHVILGMGDPTARAMEDAPKVNNQGCRMPKTPREPA